MRGWGLLTLVVHAFMRAAKTIDVHIHGIVLVVRASEVVAESTAASKTRRVVYAGVGRTVRCSFRGELVRRADGRNPRAGGREHGDELSLAPAVVADARFVDADAEIAAGDEHCHTARAQLREHGADPPCIRLRYRLLVVVVARSDDLWQGIPPQNVVEPFDVRLVRVDGRPFVWLKVRRTSTYRPRIDPDGPRHAGNSLNILICSDRVMSFELGGVQRAVLHRAAVDRGLREVVGICNGIRTVLGEELSGVWPDGHIAQVVHEADPAFAGDRRIIIGVV